MRLIAATLLSLVATALGVVVLVLAWVLATETGLRFAVQQLHALQPERFAIGAVDGRLIGPLTLRNVELKTTTSRLTANYVNFDWSPSRLFFGDVVIDRLHVREASLASYASAPSEEPTRTPAELLALLQPPPTIELHDIALQNFEYRAAGSKPFIIRHAELAAGADARGLHIDKLQAAGPLFAIEGHALIEPQDGHPTRGELSWQVRPPDYPAAVGHTTLSGSLQELHIGQRIAAPYRTRATVVLNDVLTEPYFKAEAHLDALKLQGIRANLPNLTVDAVAHAQGRAADIEYTAQAKIIDPAQGAFKLDLDGGLKKQLVTIRRLTLAVVDTPIRLQTNGRVDLGSEQPTLDLQADWQQLRWPLQGEPRFTSPRGHIDIAGTLKELTARLTAAMGDKGGLNGRVRREQDNIDLALDWHDLSWPLQQPRVASPQGTAQVTGTLQQYALAVNARVDTPGQSNGHVILEGTGNDKSLDLARIDLQVLQGEINGNANVAWKPQLDARINLNGTGINPGALLPDWPGALALRLQASAAGQADKLTAQLAALDLSGRLRGQNFALNARGDYRGEELQLERLSLVSGSSTVQASGTVGPTLDVNWRIDSDNLATLWPGAGGSLHGRGQASGALRQPRVEATLTGRRVRYAHYEVGQLAFEADLDLQGKIQSSIELLLQDGQAAGVELSEVHLTAHGTPQAHQLDLAAHTSTGDTALHLTGGLRESVWSFELTQARLKYPTLPAWILAEPAQGRASAHAQELDRACWTTSAKAKLCIRGQRSTAGLQAAFQLDGLPFKYFAPLMPTNIGITGELSGHGEVKQPSGELLAAAMKLTTSAGEILAPNAAEAAPAPVLRFKSAELRADLGNRGLALSLDLPLVDQGGFQLNAAIPPGDVPLTARPLSGQIRAQVRDIGFLAKLMPDVGQIGGQLQGRMQISGTLTRPALLGQLALLNGSAQLTGPGLDITELSAQLIGQRDGGLSYSVQAQSGGGTMRLAGTADLTGEAARAEMRINGQDFQAFNTKDARVFISPALHVALDTAGITVTGEVRVPRADITPKKIPPSAVTVSEDQVIIKPHQEQTPKAAEARKLHARVRLILGKDVRFEGFGLKGRIEGNLLIVQQPQRPATGSGELRIVEGEYRAYGQGLVIDTGRLLFAGGPINQPGVDIRAVRHPAEDITVGVQVRGTLKEPHLTIFSEPSMTQAEQLSWLVLGRPLQGASGSESAMLSQAALALGLKGGDFLAKKLGKNLGVDTIGIETGSGEAGAASSPQEASLVIGKYLSPKLYVSYGIGLFNQISTVSLQYTLSSRWKLATESSSEASGGDLIYTIER